ncbi:HAD superfamily hydrolase (TIGR01484 family) [Promicromonospora sp. AC04]|uniref:HAD family hydrolase n=1 Tax=Promicromonospora sp. AC04 TaxID=2135723 RepID=UPI000D36493D|nr:HAD family hydrolase [Promicromonospora sp. AC04]PUB27701.1 HAD superfamily hydrolase (TIGR01484 family) [Promicromonospora sp. AC04]
MIAVGSHARLLVALDIDGTIMASDGTIATPVDRSIGLVRAAGHQIVLATGRSLAGALPVIERLGLTDGHVVCSNGGLTIRLDTSAPGGYRFARSELFDATTVIRRVLELEPATLVAVEEPGWGWRVNTLFEPTQVNGEQKTASVADLCSSPATRVALAAPGLRRHLEALRETGVTVTPAGESWLDVTGPEVTKASALEALRERLGIPPEATVAVGDSENDLDALVWAGRGISMGHGPSTVRAAADEVTGTIDEHGAATALDSLLPAIDTTPLPDLAAQLAVAVDSAPGVAKLRVWHRSGADLAGAEIQSAVARAWVRHAPIPAADGGTMLTITDAADQAGLGYPTTDLGLRARWTKTKPDDGTTVYELPIWQR